MSEQPPPPPPPVSPPPAAPPPDGYDAVAAIRHGWTRFTRAPASLLVPVLLMLVVVGVVAVVVNLLLAATLLGTHDCTQTVFGQRIDTQCGPGLFLRLLGAAVSAALVGIVAQLFYASLVRGGLDAVDGKPVSLGAMWQGWDKGQVVVAAVIVSVATALGVVLCYVGSIVVGFLLQYTLYFVVDRQMSAVDAVKASFTFTTTHLGPTILFYLLSLVVVAVGALLCGIGLLVAVPVVLVGQAYTYRVLHGQEVAVL